ncbi:unnamed protein product [Paramecium primaurelia]|uniref:Uncharacterized protein n=1 Tax=Paramecium primaurelia TaxID=5886 RepID=A0A8S1K2L6_PARPR|nr:unnamed protein product [Paramecium primaurelia]
MPVPNSSYPIPLRTVLKIAPVCMVLTTLGTLLPVCLYDILYHSHERIDKFFWRSSRFERFIRCRDMKLRTFWYEAMEWQPSGRESFIQTRPQVADP